MICLVITNIFAAINSKVAIENIINEIKKKETCHWKISWRMDIVEMKPGHREIIEME
jgi:hypothetical protein